MDGNLSQRVLKHVEQSRILVAETHRVIEDARVLIGRQRRRVKLNVKEINGVVFVSGLAAQENTLHLCGEFKKLGVRTSIGMLPGVAGYQVSIYQVGLAETKAMLAELGFDVAD